MIIDWHAHVVPPEEADAPFWQGRCPATIEHFLNAHRSAGVDISVVSNSLHYMRNKSDAEELKTIQRWNEFSAELQMKYEGELFGLASTVPCGGPPYVKQLEHAIKELGLKGVIINSSYKGHYPDDDEARPFWEAIQDLDVPVMIHPPSVGFGEERMRDYRLASSIGRPFDNMLAISRLIVRGILEDFPRLKIIGSHGGGGICEVIGRMSYAWEMQDEAYFLGNYVPMKIKRSPLEYLKMFYADTVCYHAPAVRCVLETLGSDHVLYGSDAPPLTSLKPRAIKLIDDLELPASDKDKIFWRNAAKLLKLHIAESAMAE